MSAPRPSPVIVVTGPTASGKSHTAIELAERFGGEIVNADSMQVYRHLDIGTAKPSAAARARVPHHLYDIVEPDVQYDAGRYAREAAEAVERIHARGCPAFVVGGSGLYIKALLEGLSVGVGRDPELRRTLEEEDRTARLNGDPERLHRRLQEIDPTTAGALHPNDRVRLVRALELHAATGVAPSVIQRESRHPQPWRVVQLALDPGRDALALRIDQRCEEMIDGGLLQEVRALRDRGYGPELPSMRAIGYRHMQPVIDGVETLVGVLAEMKRDTRRFARRQRTWLRGVTGAEWMTPEPIEALLLRTKRFLADEPA